MGHIIFEEMDCKLSLIVNDCSVREHHLSSWILQQPSSPYIPSTDATPEVNLPVSRAALRVLELGCGSGSWCFRVKEENRAWTVHGVDDTNHWLCVYPERTVK
jgi:hypothetical protein